jgi:hypothetical protein
MASITISDLRPVGSELLLDSQLFQTLTDEEAKKIAGGLATRVINFYHDGRLIRSVSDGVNDGIIDNNYTYSNP